jgi:hypothetical protein
MDANDLAVADCLGTLLDDQAARLRSLALRVGAGLGRARLENISRSDWSGPARQARDELVSRIGAELSHALSALERAATESARAASTLAGRG